MMRTPNWTISLMHNTSSAGESLKLSSADILKDVKISEDRVRELLSELLIGLYPENAEKQEVISFMDRFTINCPYCGDSEDIRKRRGNIYFDSLGYHCFNCGQHGSLDSLLSDYQEFCNIESGELLRFRIHNKNFQKLTRMSVDVLDKKIIDSASLKRSYIMDKLGFVDVAGTPAEKYLRGRYQTYFDYFAYDRKQNSVIIFNMDAAENVIGYVTRKLYSSSGSKYFTYKLNKIYGLLGLEVTKDVEYLDSISNIFNILTISFYSPITVFEGPFDSFLYKNSMAVSGLTKGLPLEIEKVQFWLDYDEPGRTKSRQMFKEGHKVFLWKKFFRAVGIEDRGKKWDLNDLISYKNKKNIEFPNFDDFFSNSKLDFFYI